MREVLHSLVAQLDCIIFIVVLPSISILGELRIMASNSEWRNGSYNPINLTYFKMLFGVKQKQFSAQILPSRSESRTGSKTTSNDSFLSSNNFGSRQFLF